MSQENKDLIHRWFSEVWNKGNNEAIDEMLTDTTVIHGLTDTGGVDIKGPAAFREFHKQFRAAFEGLEVTVEDTIAEGDKGWSPVAVFEENTVAIHLDSLPLRQTWILLESRLSE
jgi:ketosteroid isomerase-like protein